MPSLLMFPEHESAFIAYKTFSAITLHFTSQSYDFFRYNGKTNTSESSFLKRPDKAVFFRLSKLDDLPNRVVARIVDSRNPKSVRPHDVVDKSGLAAYDAWWDRTSDMAGLLRRDLERLPDDPRLLFQSNTPLLRLMSTGTISVETVALLVSVLQQASTLDSVLADNLRWPVVRLLLQKYLPFITVDRRTVTSAIRSRWPT